MTRMHLRRAARRAATARPWLEELRATLRLAWPLVLLQLGQVGIHTTDVLMMARLGPEDLAAGSLAMHWFILPWLFCLGLLSGVPALAAQARGARDPRGVRRTVRQGLWLAVAVSLPTMVLLWHTPWILRLAGQEAGLAEAAGGYVRAAMWGLAPSMGFVVLRSFVAVLSRPAVAMMIMLAGVLFNVVVNYGLIFGNFGLPRLELVGAGLGSTLVHSAMFLGLLAYVLLDRRFRRFYLLARFFRSDWPRMAALVRVGWPVGFILLFEVGLFTAGTFMMGWVGTTALAASALATQLTNVSFMVPLGIGQAASVRVGIAAGARDREGVRRAGWSALALAAASMSIAALLYLTIPERLLGLFLDLSDPESGGVLVLGVGFLTIAAFFQIADGSQVVGSSILRGLSDTRRPMLYSAFGYWAVGCLSAYLLAFHFGFGGLGIWIGWALGLSTTAVLLLHRFSRREALGLLEKVYRS
ncbi:MAG TPA: MATE family efflux transporter [Kiloniellales bacterium]|nr:MATE family efflux transporter [Kiloniellales bacterium]